jgi:hypothetical protein
VFATYKANSSKMTREFEKSNAEYQRQAAAADAKLEMKLAVVETKIENLANEVRRHNGFAERLPALEAQVNDIKEQIK